MFNAALSKSVLNSSRRSHKSDTAVAQRFGKLSNVVRFKSAMLQSRLALLEGDEEAFIEEEQAESGKPLEKQSVHQVQQTVKQWKEAKSKEVSATVANDYNLFTGEDELERSQSVGESEEDIVIENESASIQNSDLNSTPTTESEEGIAPAELIQSFTDEENLCVDLEKKRTEMQKLPDEISMLIQTTADTKLD